MKTGGFVVLQRLSTVLRHFVSSPSPSARGPRDPASSAGEASEWPTHFRPDRDLARLVLDAIEEEMANAYPAENRERATTQPRTVTTSKASPAPVLDSAADARLAAMVTALFELPRLQAIEAGRRAEAEALTREAMRVAALANAEELAREQEDEDAALLLLLD